MRIFNETIRKAAYCGLHVDLQVVEMRRSEGPTPVPQVPAATAGASKTFAVRGGGLSERQLRARCAGPACGAA